MRINELIKKLQELSDRYGNHKIFLKEYSPVEIASPIDEITYYMGVDPKDLNNKAHWFTIYGEKDENTRRN